jgi:hypothetical protein
LDWSNRLGHADRSPFYHDSYLPKKLCYDINGDLLFSPKSFMPQVLTIIPIPIYENGTLVGYDYNPPPSYIDSSTYTLKNVKGLKMNIGKITSSNNEIAFSSERIGPKGTEL